MKRLAILSVIMAAVILLVAGCGEYATYTPSALDLTRLATEVPDGPVKQTAEAIALSRFGTAQAAESQAQLAQVTAQVAEMTRQAYDQQARQQYVMLTAAAQATQDAHRRELEQQHVWATQQAANATQVAQATAQTVAIQATQQAQAIEATATERAYQATSTAEALSQQATATAEARNVAATTTAQHKADVATATAAAIAYEATSTRQAWEAKTTATAEYHQATAQAAHATMTRQAEKREEVLGYGKDYGIPLVLLVIAGGIGVLVIYGIRQQARRPVVYPRNLLGDAEPMACPVQGGGYTFVDLDRQPGPALQVLPDGTVNAPLLRSAGQEERTTARDQMLDAVSRPRLGGGQKAPAPALPAPPQAPAPGLRSVRVLRRLDQAERAGYLPPPLVAALAADWEVEE